MDLEKTSLFVRSGASALPFAALLIALARKRRKASANLRGCIEMDPLGVLAHEGRYHGAPLRAGEPASGSPPGPGHPHGRGDSPHVHAEEPPTTL